MIVFLFFFFSFFVDFPADSGKPASFLYERTDVCQSTRRASRLSIAHHKSSLCTSPRCAFPCRHSGVTSALT